MKKFFIIMLVLCGFGLPVSAGQLQTVYEQKLLDEYSAEGAMMKDFLASPVSMRKALLAEDYEHYLKGGKSVYGEFVGHKKGLSSQDVLDKKYMTRMLGSIDSCLANKDYKSSCEYISIEDNEYKEFKEKTKEFMAMYNCIYTGGNPK